MCGLFGILVAENHYVSSTILRQFKLLASKSQRRGSDASGILVVSGENNIGVIKSNSSIADLLNSSAYSEFPNLHRNERPVRIFGHTRLETHGTSSNPENNQPVTYGIWSVLHNGIISNAAEIMERYSVGSQTGEVDSKSLAVLLEEWHISGRESSVDSFMKQVLGEVSFIAVSLLGDVLAFTNVGNIYVGIDSAGNSLIASEPGFLPDTVRSSAVQLKKGEVVVLKQQSVDGLRGQFHESHLSYSDESRKGMTRSPRSDTEITSFDLMADRITEHVKDKINKVRRCSVCALPDSYPGIRFDISGVCSICQNYAAPILAGEAKMVSDLRALAPDGNTVLLGLSGGRDSCFALHYLHHLGFKVICFTYDWGMVTTAARVNMARICGELGVEHIVVSPNLKRNKARINRALVAWLKRPNLGTLPILMAGDKPYFRFSKLIARERGGIPIVMADHALETTGFKSMLAGAKPSSASGEGVGYRLGAKSLTKMSFTYLRHAALSPGLIRSVAGEGLTGFVDYYIRSHDFFKPFAYVEWNETEIELILRSKYGWTTGTENAVPSWRMGDGTAPFYNLMYAIALGMTEHDTFRANQVRAGLIERGKALSCIKEENLFDRAGLTSYLATVGVEPIWAIQKIQNFVESGSN